MDKTRKRKLKPELESLRGFGVSDPNTPNQWVYNDPEVEVLRSHLRHHNGIRGLEICEPHAVKRAARISHRDGFVVVRVLLNAEQLTHWRGGCTQVLADILSVSGQGDRKYLTETERLPHLYSYGTSSVSRQMLHDLAWARMD